MRSRRDDGSGSTEESVAVTFYPQEWTDSPGETHDWDRRQLVPADGRESVTFPGRTRPTATPLPDESHEANLLQEHPAAPDWNGPYYVVARRLTGEEEKPRIGRFRMKHV